MIIMAVGSCDDGNENYDGEWTPTTVLATALMYDGTVHTDTDIFYQSSFCAGFCVEVVAARDHAESMPDSATTANK